MDGRILPSTCVFFLGLLAGARSLEGGEFSEQRCGTRTNTASASIDLLFFDPAGLVRERDAFEDEVERILTPAGVTVRFLRTSGAIETSGGRTPLIATLFDKEASAFALKDRVMGVTAEDGKNHWNVFLFYPSILRTLAPDPALRATRLGRTRWARAVARVLVHEMVHFVAPLEPHAPSGLMKHCLTRRSLTRPDASLDRSSQRTLLAGLERRLPLARECSRGAGRSPLSLDRLAGHSRVRRTPNRGAARRPSPR